MTSPPIKYTTNRAIDHFNVAATLMKIIGYVDCIEGLRELPKSPSKWIYKCILNNNDGRRVRILCSGDDALKYKDEIKMYQIIKITGGIIKAANPQYRRSTDTVSDKEFQFARRSTFDIFGTFNITNGADNGRSKVISYKKLRWRKFVLLAGQSRSLDGSKSHSEALPCPD
ncbi:uncharacterized protein LOC135167885 isoform X1 [Diachasmimorpha longicaudata]|uniref:uncharacterized protein LOC135162001 isoform X1 n=1 Tax=Diachasmimorpha longicaudata TaxID=58733 RepID=UPI0030B8A1A2